MHLEFLTQLCGDLPTLIKYNIYTYFTSYTMHKELLNSILYSLSKTADSLFTNQMEQHAFMKFQSSSPCSQKTASTNQSTSLI